MKRMNSNTWRAIQRVKDRLREGGVLMQMHTVHGKRWFVLPGKKSGREVADEIAALVICEADVHGGKDGLWPGVDQTYKMTAGY